ncbi:MAG: F0F1 ATP synthase subunit A [Thermomicrobiales bacterium]|nr:F0F1 ATP synthase subunit A [Chloroflexia bacterium]
MEIHISIAAETLFNVGPVPVTNSMLTMFIIMGLLLIGGAAIGRNAKLVPGRWQSLFEATAGFILELVEGTGGKTFGRRIFPLVGAIFVFIAVANYSGVLPGVGTIGFYRDEAAEASATHEGETAVVEGGEGEAVVVDESTEHTETDVVAATDEHATDEEHHGPTLVPLFRAPNADLNMTLAMALVTFTTIQVYGIRAHGVGGRIKHMADPPFLFPIELVSEFGRIISLSARLFGNVFAGEVLLGVMYALANAVKIAIIPLFVPVIFIFLELLFGTIQALVFALLTAIYVTMAGGESGHGDEAHGHDEAGDQNGAHPVSAPASAAAGD